MSSGTSIGKRRRPIVTLALTGIAVSFGLLAGCSTKPVAEVNGQKLTEQEFAKLCETSNPDPQSPMTVGGQVLMRWVRNTLFEQKAKDMKVYPTEKDLDERIDAMRKQAAFGGADFDAQMRERCMPTEAIRRDFLSGLVTENVLFSGFSATDAEAREQFDKTLKKRLTQPEQVRISQITVDKPEDAKKVQADLAAGGDTFSLVAQSRSKDQFARNGGAIPESFPKQIQPGLPVSQASIDAAFKLKQGEWAGPLKQGATFVFVKLDQKVPEKVPNFDDFKVLIKLQIRQDKARGQAPKIQQELMEMIQKADVKIYRPEYAPIQAQMKQPAAGPGGQMPGGAPPAPPGGGG